MTPKRRKYDATIWTACMAFGLAIMLFELAVASARADRRDKLAESMRRSFEEFRAAEDRSWTDYRNGERRISAAGPAAESLQDVQPDARTVSQLLVDAVIQVESSGNPRKVGSMGERGLMQVKRDTWAEVTRRAMGGRIPFERAFEPELNRRVGTAYLAEIQAFLQANRSKWKADERSLLLACYNAGPSRVKAAGFGLRGLPASTRDYVQRAGALHDYYLAERSAALARAFVPPQTGKGPDENV